MINSLTGTYDWTRSATLFAKQLGWITIIERMNYFTCLLTYKAVNNLAPIYLSDTMNRVGLSVFNTRAATDLNLVLPNPSLEFFKRSFRYCGPQKWNLLPNNVKKSATVNTLKKRLKHHINHTS